MISWSPSRSVKDTVLFTVYSESHWFQSWDEEDHCHLEEKNGKIKVVNWCSTSVKCRESNSKLQLDSIPFSVLEAFCKHITCRSICVKLKSITVKLGLNLQRNVSCISEKHWPLLYLCHTIRQSSLGIFLFILWVEYWMIGSLVKIRKNISMDIYTLIRKRTVTN